MSNKKPLKVHPKLWAEAKELLGEWDDMGKAATLEDAYQAVIIKKQKLPGFGWNFK